nr:spermidine/putrescine ABC transporter ATP-binding protein [Bacillus cereus]
MPLFAGSKPPPQNPANTRKLGGRSTARKSPIGEG